MSQQMCYELIAEMDIMQDSFFFCCNFYCINVVFLADFVKMMTGNVGLTQEQVCLVVDRLNLVTS